MAKKMLVVLGIAAFALAGCGSDDNDDAGDATPTTPAASSNGTTPPDDEDEPSDPDGEVPDPCALIEKSDLQAMLGSDPGNGTVNAVVPDQRKVCQFDAGPLLAVELADHYDISVEGIKDIGGTVEEVSGLGEAAIFQDLGGGNVQFHIKGDQYFVGVTLANGDKAKAQAIAEAMLEKV